MKLFSFSLFIALLLIFLLLSCNSEKNQSKYELIQDNKAQVIITLDEHSSGNTKCSQLIADSLLALLNSRFNSIDIYNINEGRLKQRIIAEIEGPNGVGHMDGFYIKNIDSIYTAFRSTYLVSLINSKAKVLSQSNIITNNWQLMPFISAGQKVGFDKNFINIIGIFRGDPYMKKEEYFNEAVAGVQVDLSTDSVKPMQIKYPSIYKKVRASSHFYDTYYLQTEQNDIYSFPLDDSITYVNRKEQTVLNVFAGTKSKKSFTELKSIQRPSAQEALDNYFENYYYNWILYDEFRKVYYRLVEHPANLDLSQKPNSNPWEIYKRNYSIIILGEDFEKVGETLLSDDFHPHRVMFVNRTGLFIKKRTTNEDEMILECFSLSKI